MSLRSLLEKGDFKKAQQILETTATQKRDGVMDESSWNSINEIVDSCSVHEAMFESCSMLHLAIAKKAPVELLRVLCRLSPTLCVIESTYTCCGVTIYACLPIHLALHLAASKEILYAICSADKRTLARGCVFTRKNLTIYTGLPIHLAIEVRASLDTVSLLCRMYPDGVQADCKYGSIMDNCKAIHVAMYIQASPDIVQFLVDFRVDTATMPCKWIASDHVQRGNLQVQIPLKRKRFEWKTVCYSFCAGYFEMYTLETGMLQSSFNMYQASVELVSAASGEPECIKFTTFDGATVMREATEAEYLDSNLGIMNLLRLVKMENSAAPAKPVKGCRKLPIEILSSVQCRGPSIREQLAVTTSNKGLRDSHAALISVMLVKSGVAAVDMSQNWIGSGGAQMIIDQLPFMAVTSIDMAHNCIQSLRPSLLPFKRLTRLVLRPGNENLSSKLRNCSPEQAVLKLDSTSKDISSNFMIPVHIVGHSKSGKSTLARSLTSEAAFDGTLEAIDVSPAVDMLTRTFNYEKRRIDLRFIDYKGGADSTYACAHRPFLQNINDGVVMLCWRPRSFEFRKKGKGFNIEQESVLSFVLDWIETISSYSPTAKIILVATHTDSIPPKRLEKQCKEMFEALQAHGKLQKSRHDAQIAAIRTQLMQDMPDTERTKLLAELHKQHETGKHARILNSRSICVSSLTGAGFDELLKQLLKAVRSVSLYGAKVPAPFLDFQAAIVRYKNDMLTDKRERARVLSMDKILQIAARNKLVSRSSVLAAISWHSQFGDMIYLGQDNAQTQDFIIIDPRWFSELQRRVICHSHRTEISLRKDLPSNLTTSYARLQRHGELTLPVAQWLFQDLLHEGKRKTQDLHNCLHLLEACGVLFGVSALASATKLWLVPCLFSGHRRQTVPTLFCDASDFKTCCWFKYKYIPAGFFEACICTFGKVHVLSAIPVISHVGQARRVLFETQATRTLFASSQHNVEDGFTVLVVSSSSRKQMRYGIETVKKLQDAYKICCLQETVGWGGAHKTNTMIPLAVLEKTELSTSTTFKKTQIIMPLASKRRKKLSFFEMASSTKVEDDDFFEDRKVVTVLQDAKHGLGLELQTTKHGNTYIAKLLKHKDGTPGTAERAGVSRGDILFSVDGKKVLRREKKDVAIAIQDALLDDDAVTFELLSVEPAFDFDEADLKARQVFITMDERHGLGMSINQSDKGNTIIKSIDDHIDGQPGAAERAGIHVNDILFSVDDTVVLDLPIDEVGAHIKHALKSSSNLDVQVIRADRKGLVQRLTLEADPDDGLGLFINTTSLGNTVASKVEGNAQHAGIVPRTTLTAVAGESVMHLDNKFCSEKIKDALASTPASNSKEAAKPSVDLEFTYVIPAQRKPRVSLGSTADTATGAKEEASADADGDMDSRGTERNGSEAKQSRPGLLKRTKTFAKMRVSSLKKKNSNSTLEPDMDRAAIAQTEPTCTLPSFLTTAKDQALQVFVASDQRGMDSSSRDLCAALQVRFEITGSIDEASVVVVILSDSYVKDAIYVEERRAINSFEQNIFVVALPTFSLSLPPLDMPTLHGGHSEKVHVITDTMRDQNALSSQICLVVEKMLIRAYLATQQTEMPLVTAGASVESIIKKHDDSTATVHELIPHAQEDMAADEVGTQEPRAILEGMATVEAKTVLDLEPEPELKSTKRSQETSSETKQRRGLFGRGKKVGQSVSLPTEKKTSISANTFSTGNIKTGVAKALSAASTTATTAKSKVSVAVSDALTHGRASKSQLPVFALPCGSCVSFGQISPAYFVRSDCVARLHQLPRKKKSKRKSNFTCKNCGRLTFLEICPFEVFITLSSVNSSHASDHLEDETESPFTKQLLRLTSHAESTSPNFELAKRTKFNIEKMCQVTCDMDRSNGCVEARVQNATTAVFFLDENFIYDKDCVIAWLTAKLSAKHMIPLLLPGYDHADMFAYVEKGSMVKSLKSHSLASSTGPQDFTAAAIAALNPIDFTTLALQMSNMEKLAVRIESSLRDERFSSIWRQPAKQAATSEGHDILRTAHMMVRDNRKSSPCEVQLSRESFLIKREKAKQPEKIALIDIGNVEVHTQTIGDTEMSELYVKLKTSHEKLQEAAAELFFLTADAVLAIGWRDAILNARNAVLERIERFGFKPSTAKNALEREAIDAFHAVDSDGSGMIERDELRLLLRNLIGAEVPSSQVDRAMTEADASGDACIDEFEFISWYRQSSYWADHRSRLGMEAEATALFADLDSDGDGFIDKDEITAIMTKILGAETPNLEAIVNDAFAHADKDGNGQIDRDEFCSWFRYAPFWKENLSRLKTKRSSKEDEKAAVIAQAYRKHRSKREAKEVTEKTSAALVMQGRFRKRKVKRGED